LFKRYLPEVLFFGAGLLLISTFRFDGLPDSDAGEFLFVVAPLVAAVLAILSLGPIRETGPLIAPLAGLVLPVCILFLVLFATVPEALGLVVLAGFPLFAIALFIVKRIRLDRGAAIAYAGGFLVLTGAYYAVPWMSDVAWVAVTAPSMQSTWVRPPGAPFTDYIFDEDDGFDGRYSAYLVYDGETSDTKTVLNEFAKAQTRGCQVGGNRIIGHYYAARVYC
jgi:hypothetical protein